jgi:hypothetical protein
MAAPARIALRRTRIRSPFKTHRNTRDFWEKPAKYMDR